MARALGLWGGAGLSLWQGLYSLMMLFVGALQVLDGNMSLGMFFAFQNGPTIATDCPASIVKFASLRTQGSCSPYRNFTSRASSRPCNVGFFDAHIDMEQVERACRLAHVHDDVMRTSMGYHSLIGDMGSV